MLTKLCAGATQAAQYNTAGSAFSALLTICSAGEWITAWNVTEFVFGNGNVTVVGEISADCNTGHRLKIATTLFGNATYCTADTNAAYLGPYQIVTNATGFSSVSAK